MLDAILSTQHLSTHLNPHNNVEEGTIRILILWLRRPRHGEDNYLPNFTQESLLFFLQDIMPGTKVALTDMERNRYLRGRNISIILSHRSGKVIPQIVLNEEHLINISRNNSWYLLSC